MNKLDFDQIIHSQFDNTIIIDYGIINGSETIVFIKAGQDGSIYGYNNKYLTIAHTINKKYGYTVICSSNPFNGVNPLDNAMEVIEKYCKENQIQDYIIYYMGHSNGALIGAWFGYKYPKIKRMLLVNGPLMFNYYKTKDGILKFNGEKINFVYGSLDQSYPYVGLLDRVINEKIKVNIIEGQNHHFSNDTYDFKKLPEDYLL